MRECLGGRLCTIVRPLHPAGISTQSQLQTECIREAPVRSPFNRLLLRCPDGSVWGPFPKISEAMDGRREAHTDVLVAVFGKGPQTQPTTIESRLGPKLRPHAPKQSLKLGDILLDVVYERLHGGRRVPGLGVDHAPAAAQGEAGDIKGLQGTQGQL